jgi:ATP-dependent DNA helicase RecG
MTDIRTHLSRLDRPLQYAARDDFRNLPRLRDLESFVQHQVRVLQSLPLPAPMPDLLGQLAGSVLGFDDLALAEKRQRVQQAAQILSRLRILADGGDTRPVSAPPPEPAVPPTPTPAAASEDPLAQPVQYLRGVGPRRAALLAKLSLHTVGDLLWCLPARYEDRRNLTPLGMLQIGSRQTFCGTVTAFQLHHTSRGRSFATLRVEDSSAPLTCKWFQHRGLALQDRFPVGARVVGNGIIAFNRYDGSRVTVHPDLEVLEADDAELIHFGRLVPIYPLTTGLTQKNMRSLMHNTVENFAPLVRETLPASVCNAHRLPALSQAVRGVHFPDDNADLAELNEQRTASHARLVFEEFFLLELGLAIRHRQARAARRDKHYDRPNHLGEALLSHLPFRLTAAQQRVLDEILADMRRPFPMNRLIQGDVGSGKTIVALLAMLLAVSNGQQAAFMAPTELLAEQHAATLRALLQHLDLEVALLTGTVKGGSRRKLLQRIADGEVAVLVGTHALLYENVQFHGLGMIVVDEQHRFGVMQRAGLRRKGLRPDVLVMTATPIPRTLAMTLYGDLDLSVVDELPPGRLPVKTVLLSEKRREHAYDVVRREVGKGHQAYIVYPLIEESESLDLGAAAAMAEHLRHTVFPKYEVGLLHGRLGAEERDAIMGTFAKGRLQILVSTTIIEVGVDIANATVMLIENAERFGLAQLHQLRGRVGRGSARATCLLLPGQKMSREGRHRLKVMQESTDGFYVAEQDLQIRGPGELLGTRQSGLPELRIGNILHHGAWLERARQAAFALLDEDPRLNRAEHRALLQAVQARWGRQFELATIG